MQPAVLEQLAQHNIAHAETKRRQVGAAETAEQRVIASAAADGAQCTLRVKELEDGPRVVRQAANNRRIEINPFSETHFTECRERPSQWRTGWYLWALSALQHEFEYRLGSLGIKVNVEHRCRTVRILFYAIDRLE